MNSKSEPSLTVDEQSVIAQMMADLPAELTSEQRAKVEALLICHRGILSVSEHDIGRTHLVEHRIDTGNARPIRQPLRHQAFQHAQFIKEETARMLEHEPVGIKCSART